MLGTELRTNALRRAGQSAAQWLMLSIECTRGCLNIVQQPTAEEAVAYDHASSLS